MLEGTRASTYLALLRPNSPPGAIHIPPQEAPLPAAVAPVLIPAPVQALMAHVSRSASLGKHRCAPSSSRSKAKALLYIKSVMRPRRTEETITYSSC